MGKDGRIFFSIMYVFNP